LPVTSAVQSFQSVTYPALSNIKDNAQKFADSYCRVMAITAAVMFPVMVGMVAVADDMFALLLGARWMPTVPYFKVLSLTGLFYPLSMIAYNVLKVAGDGRIILRLEVVKKAIMTIILVATIPHSTMAVAWGLVAMSATEFAVNLLASLRFAQISLWRMAKTLMPVAALTALMFASVEVVGLYTTNFSIFARFVAQIFSGVAVYIVLALTFRLSFAVDILETIKRFFRK
ncbi:MAG: oligosaccharide flippase family protein, partial [Alistipes sp.]|nr:oligosaccharide flippase family protein [Alistipes sp.]